MRRPVLAIFAVCASTSIGEALASAETAQDAVITDLRASAEGDRAAERVAEDRLTDEEYAMLRAVMLPYAKGRGLLVVDDRTSTSMMSNPSAVGAGPELTAAFTRANARPAILEAERFRLSPTR